MNKKEFTKVEKAKLLKSIRDSSVIGENYELMKKLIIEKSDDAEAIDNTIRGLSEEDEFALLCRQMQTTTHLIPLEQRPFISGTYIVPDFLAKFQPSCSIAGYSNNDSKGFKCFIDVKSTHEYKVKIGGSKLKRLRNFANEFGYPLIIAVRFLSFHRNALWVIIHDEDQSKTSITISIENFLSQIRYILWDEYWYLIPFDVKFRSIINNSSEIDGVSTPYGVQEKIEIITGNKVVSFEGAMSVLVSAFFETFILQEQEVVKIDKNYTAQILQPKLYVCSMVDMVYSLNLMPQDSQGRSTHNSSQTVRQLRDTAFDINLINSIAEKLSKEGLLFFAGFASKEEHFEKWLKYGGSKENK